MNSRMRPSRSIFIVNYRGFYSVNWRIGVWSITSIVVALILMRPSIGQTATVSQGVGVSITIEGVAPTPTPPPPSGGGGGGGGSISPTPTPQPTFASLTVKGKAYPGAVVTILRSGAVAKTLIVDAVGNFEATLSGLPSGIQTFSFFAEDTNGQKSVTISLTLNLIANTTTTVEGIIIPLTIAISSSTVNQGQPLFVFGQSVPESDINLFFQSSEFVKRTGAAKSGAWRYELDTQPLEIGDHSVRAKAQIKSGEQSEFSETKMFKIVPPGVHAAPGTCLADLNDDNRADITDLSILLYNWGVPKNARSDYNKDGRVDIIDFSILLYYWGTCV